MCHPFQLPGGTQLRNIAARLLILICLGSLALTAEAKQGCDVEKAQRLFGQQPRPTAEVRRLLAACQASGSTDYRVYMFLGVIARDAGDRELAAIQLRKAHEMAQQEPNPALELGVTLEAGQPKEARIVYEQVLALNPTSRPATLGLARVARSQNRLDEANQLYTRLLSVDPQDPDALNGMAWLYLANRYPDRARAGFEHVLQIAPTNEEAKAGLSSSRDVYRDWVEVNSLMVSSDHRTSMGVQVRGTAAISAFDSLELGWLHYDNELPTVSAIGISILPSQDITLGYHRFVPLSYAFSVVYDDRQYSVQPTEHWLDVGGTVYITDKLQWFGAYRKSFGAERYDGRLIRTGLSALVTPSWLVTATIYNSQQATFQNFRDLWSEVIDVSYLGPHNMIVVVGAGVSPLIDNFNVHARATLPVTDTIAFQLNASHDKINSATVVTGGLAFTW